MDSEVTGLMELLWAVRYSGLSVFRSSVIFSDNPLVTRLTGQSVSPCLLRTTSTGLSRCQF
jgi:hypothetical protein